MKKILSILLISMFVIGIFTGCTTTGITNNLSQDEIQGLVYLVEEEKLARDVYTYLYDKWGIQTFGSILNSEQTHMNAIVKLLSEYGIDNPTQNKDNGVFENQDLQNLYNNLISTGSKSEIEALKVGSLIEEVDIIDLENRINETNNKDIINVYENLMDGSENHLNAFVSKLSTFGVEYSPQYLSLDRYNAIIGLKSNSNNDKGNTDTITHSTQKGGQNGRN